MVEGYTAIKSLSHGLLYSEYVLGVSLQGLVSMKSVLRYAKLLKKSLEGEVSPWIRHDNLMGLAFRGCTYCCLEDEKTGSING
jgi:hypothetical protein